jgi:hypothetical protein
MNEDTMASSGDGGSSPDVTENDRLLAKLVRDTASERTRLARLSQRVTGASIRPSSRRASLLDQFDHLAGGGDRSLGQLGRLLLLFQEERERAQAGAGLVFDIRTGKCIKPDVDDEVSRRVLRRLAEGDVIPGLLFRERPHLAPLAPLVEAVVQEQRELRAFRRGRRTRRYN